MLAIEINDVDKRFADHEALHALTLSVRQGEIVGLLGSNGAGKSTTLKLLLGMLAPTAGSVRVFGMDPVSSTEAVKAIVGYVPDEPRFYDFLTGKETLAFIARVRQQNPERYWERVKGIAQALELEEGLDAMVATYSLGMRKKLALLCAMAHAPKLLLLDEPSNGLDPKVNAQFRQLLKTTETTTLLSTHLLDSAELLCNRQVLIHKGRVCAQGSSEEIKQQAGLPTEARLEEAYLLLVNAA